MIVSTTLAHKSEGLEETISLVRPYVDKTIVINTSSGVLDVRASVLTYHEWEDFATARNYALDCAKDAGATWAITVDSDMRYTGLENLKHWNQLCSPVGMIEHASKTYARELFHKIPANGMWHGATHEAYVYNGESAIKLPNIYFDELPKTETELNNKFQRDVVLLRQQIAKDPTDSRWWFYLGESYKGLKNWQGALEGYATCMRMYGWDEEAAWAAYQAAQCYVERGELKEALNVCCYGLARMPTMPELHWYAGWIEYQRKRYHEAIHWSKQALSVVQTERLGFRYPFAWDEGPKDVINWAEKGIK